VLEDFAVELDTRLGAKPRARQLALVRAGIGHAQALEGPDEQGLRLPRIGVRLFEDIERLA
jgi:hypothetical protein